MSRSRFLLLGLALVSGCSTSDQSAGGSSYETENAVAVRLVLPDGSPASQTLVQARPLDWVEGEPFDTTLDQRTDLQGRVRFLLPAGTWRLQARKGGLISAIDIPKQERLADLGTLRLTSPASVWGRTEPGAQVGASGLVGATTADAQGVFHLDSLPAGIHVLRRIGSQARAYVQVQAGQSLDAGTLREETAGRIFLEDFEDGDARSRFGAWTGDGWWWISATPDVHLSPDGADANPGLSVFADGGGGKVFHISADFPSVPDPSSRMSCGVGFGPLAIDLSDLRSVRFRARGIGTAILTLQGDPESGSGDPTASVLLDSTWKTFDIPLEDLKPVSWTGSATDSSERARKLRHSLGLSWSLTASGDLWLDDIQLIGPSTTLLWGSFAPP